MHANPVLATGRSVTSSARSWWSRDLALPFEPWTVLWAVALATPWLLPTHMMPWRAFHSDMLMALVLLPAAFWAVLRRRERVPVPRAGLAVLGVACIPMLQWAGGIMMFAGDAWMASIYLLGFALAIMTGARFQQIAPSRLIETLFAAFVVAGLVSVGLVLAQWLQLWPLRLFDFDLLMYYPGPLGYRPFANLGQPNHLATLLIWSMIALWWAYLSRRVSGVIAVGAAAFLLIGITATQSRTAWLEIMVLLVGAVLWRRQLAPRHCMHALAGLLALGIALAVGWEAVNHAMELEAARSFSGQMSSPGLRPAAWELFLDAALRRPWTGWGWNQVQLAQSMVALDHPTLHYTWIRTHNIVLDLVVQTGLPLGLLLTLGLVSWMIAQARRVDSAMGCLVWLAVAVLCTQALVEFPQDYAYFLLPAGLMLGALETMHPWGAPLRVSRWQSAGALLVAAVLTLWVGVEYNVAERNLERLRFERARVGPSRNSQAPDLVLLTQLRDFLRALRLRPDIHMSVEELDLMRRVTLQYPSDGNHLILAAMEGLNSNSDEATRILERMCRMVPEHRCHDSRAIWETMAKTSLPLREVKLPSPWAP
jgi:O-antigen ligase